MFGRSQFNHFLTFLALLGLAAATERYRVDDRAPVEVKADEGLKAWDPEGTGSVIDHVKKLLGTKDPWVSTTSDYNVAKGGAKSPGYIYIYYIDDTGLNPVDTLAEFARVGEEHPHPAEKEWSVHGIVPWTSITKWDKYLRNKVVETVTRADYDAAHPKSKIRSFIA